MSQGHCVIVGNGPAANTAAMTLRERVPDLRITLIGQEPARYYRPHLLPDFVCGSISEEDLYVNPLDFYEDNQINLRLGQRVVRVDFGQRQVILDHKEVVRFDGLILAVGGTPRIPEPLESQSSCMLTLKTLSDAKQWIERLSRAESVLIAGGDLTSLAFAKALVSMGKRVSFVVSEHSFWPLRFSAEIRERVTRALIERGVEVLDCRKVVRVERISESSLDVCTESSLQRADLVGAFYGLAPDVKFLSRSGLDIDRGILVDEHLRTKFSGVYAAGDCAQVYHPGIRDYWVSIGYANACGLGKIAALNLAGSSIAAEASPESMFRLEGTNVNLSWWMEY
jgi:NADPH-dependent 2,4-dienoyl-CoA reductase/sulfur reductase-like enzyme